MTSRPFASFEPAPCSIEDPPSPDALSTALLSSVSVNEVVGELRGHLADYSDAIGDLQLASGVSRAYRSEAVHFAAWLQVFRRQAADVDDGVIEDYVGHDCRCPVVRKRGKLVISGKKRRRRCARHFVAFLRDRRVIAPAEAKAVEDPQVEAYLGWLKQHRGVGVETLRRYRAEIERLVPMLGAPAQWDAAILRRTFERRSKQTPGSAALLVTIMRSYLRFLISQGQCRPALLHAIPSVQRYRLSTVPRYVDLATIEKVIAACPTDRPVEVRDKAIILLLARLGLRAGDVRDMRLDDIDWRSGHLTVKGKTRRPDRLSLPQDAGDAILAYIATSRPKVTQGLLFLRSQAPFRPFSSSAEIAGIVARTLARGGIAGLPTGAHIFRHSLATNMLRSGAGLESVGTILRHSSPETTAIYAKVDLPMLMKIAQPWPGDLSC